MSELGDIGKAFTRFFIPGLTFLGFALVLPFVLFVDSGFELIKDKLTISFALPIALLLGYILDSIRGYRWTLSYAQYTDEKNMLSSELSKLAGQTARNPDYLLSELWLESDETYSRIFGERAEWVMILETSFSLLVAAISCVGIMIYRQFNSLDQQWIVLIMSIVLFLLSWLASRNGVERMKSHNLKLIYAVKSLHENDKPVGKSEETEGSV